MPRPRGGAQQIPRPQVVTVSDSAPWPQPFGATLDSLVAAVPLDPAPMLPAFPGSRLSAVLVVLVDGADGVEQLVAHLLGLVGEVGGDVDDVEGWRPPARCSCG